MGDRIAGRTARQHPHLTRPDNHHFVLRAVILALLAVDGVLSAIFGALLLAIRVGTFPFPISAVISGLINAALVWVGLQWTSSARLAAISVWAFLLTVAAFTLGGPGDDIVFGGPGFGVYGAFVLLIVGVLPAAVVLWRRTGRGAARGKD